jgi:putative oxidoreductase
MFRTIARVLMASIFISGGSSTFVSPDGRATKVANAGIPQARQATIVNGAVMVLAGLALAVGIAPKLSALALTGTLLPTTFVGHPYWKEENPATRSAQQVQFLKNLSMLGGLLVILTEKNS